MLDQGQALVNTTGARAWEAELHRLKGELLQNAECGVQSAELTPEACFQQALAIARSQQAKSLELRAATSLARLWQQQGKRQDAYDLLALVYEWFTEDFLPFVNPYLSFFYPICTTGSRRIRLAS